jgi:integrase
MATAEGELSDATINSYRYTMKRLDAVLADRMLSSVTAEDLEAALRTQGGTSYAMHRRNARAFWRWCAKAPRGWCEVSVFEAVGNPRKPQRGEIHVLTPQEASALLQTAERHFPQAVCIYAVALFAGVRAEEIQRLDAVHFNDEGIEIPANLSQKGLRRHVPMNSTLRAWLDVYPFEPCMNWVEVDKAVRRLAGGMSRLGY